MLGRAFETFKREDDRPTLIVVDSHIGYGAPDVQDTAAAHGEPLGEEEVRLAKRSYGWPEDAQFLIPDGVVEHFAAGVGARGRALREEWERLFERYRAEHPELADQLERMQRRELPEGWDRDIPAVPRRREGHRDAQGVGRGAERGRPQRALAGGRRGRPHGLHERRPRRSRAPACSRAEDRGGRYLHFGIREHGMAASSTASRCRSSAPTARPT